MDKSYLYFMVRYNNHKKIFTNRTKRNVTEMNISDFTLREKFQSILSFHLKTINLNSYKITLFELLT